MGRRTAARAQPTRGREQKATTPPSEMLRIMRQHGSALVIDATEAEGQQELVAANGASLPIKGSTHPCFIKMGIVFGEPLDRVFREAGLPTGWKVVARPGCIVWCDLFDARDRRRAEIFYSAAFYDRRAEIRPTARYTTEVEYQGRFGIVGESHRGFVFDNETQTELFSTRTLRRETADDRRFMRTEDLQRETSEWISLHFPEHRDPAAYWE